MAKIKTLKEEMLIGGNSQEHIYPRTTTEAVYTTDNKVLQEALDEVKDGSYIRNEAIKEWHLAPSSVTNSKIKNGSITSEKIANGEVTSAKLDDRAVVTSKIEDSAVINDKLASNSVDNRVLAGNAVNTDNVVDRSITTNKLNDLSVTTQKLDMNSVTTTRIADSSITEDKIKNGSVSASKVKEDAITTSKIVNQAVTNEKLDALSVSTDKIRNYSVTNEKLSDNSITNPKIVDYSVSNEKISDNTISYEKLNTPLKDLIGTATGLPTDLIEKIQYMSDDIAEIQDSIYPITLSISSALNSEQDEKDKTLYYYDVQFSVRYKGAAFVGDTTKVLEYNNDDSPGTVWDKAASDGSIKAPLDSGKTTFKLEVTSEGHTSKSASVTKYICYAGGSTSDSISTQLVDTLNIYASNNVSFNPTINSKNSEYLWLVVPSYLNIKKVTSSGFDVTMNSPVTVTTELGTFKAYRTSNPLTAQTWNLVIS